MDLYSPYDYYAPGYDAVAINPVYLTVNGKVVGVDPVNTAKAIQTALDAAPRVGKNWSTATYYEGPVTVQWIQNPAAFSGDVSDDPAATTPWSFPTSVTTGQYVFEVTFQGEMHDANVGLGYSSVPSTMKPAAAQKDLLTFLSGDLAATNVLFQLSIDGVATGQIEWFGDTPAEMQENAYAMQAALDNTADTTGKVGTYAGLTVTYDAATNNFLVTFPDNAPHTIGWNIVYSNTTPPQFSPWLFSIEEQVLVEGGAAVALNENLDTYQVGNAGDSQNNASLSAQTRRQLRDRMDRGR